MKKIRSAQIGINWLSHSRDIFYTLKKYPDIFEIVGYCTVEGENYPDPLAEMKDYPRLTLDEILNDPTIEAVTVETDEIHLTKYAIMAAEHGKHIHMEKPGGASLPDFERLIELVKKNGKVFNTGYMYRYNPAISEAIRKVKSGELGEIRNVSFTGVTLVLNNVNESIAKAVKVAALAKDANGAKITKVSVFGNLITNYTGELPKLESAVYEENSTFEASDFSADITVERGQ